MESETNLVTMPPSWGSFAKTLYRSRQPPVVAISVDGLEAAARDKLKDCPDAFLFLFGSAGTGSTKEANYAEFKKWRIVPRVLRNVTTRTLEVRNQRGLERPFPPQLLDLLIANSDDAVWRAQTAIHPDGECASAKAAGDLGVGFVMSTASSRSIEAVAKANGAGPRWFMLYWGKETDITLSLLSRIKRCNFTVLVVTVDAMVHGWRPSDLDTAYWPLTHGIGTEVGLTDPVFMGKFGLPTHPEDTKADFPYVAERVDALIRTGDKNATERARLGQEFFVQITDTGKTWEDLANLKQHWSGPLVLKGILSVEDAELAIDYGVDGIIVSNHGGRQLDGAIPSLYALHQIMQSPKVRDAQARGTFTVMLDSGVRTGSDILKAIALGAQAVLYGRAFMYALAAGGAAGVESQIRATLADLDTSLALTGFTNLHDLRANGEKVVVKLPS